MNYIAQDDYKCTFMVNGNFSYRTYKLSPLTSQVLTIKCCHDISIPFYSGSYRVTDHTKSQQKFAQKAIFSSVPLEASIAK